MEDKFKLNLFGSNELTWPAKNGPFSWILWKTRICLGRYIKIPKTFVVNGIFICLWVCPSVCFVCLCVCVRVCVLPGEFSNWLNHHGIETSVITLPNLSNNFFSTIFCSVLPFFRQFLIRNSSSKLPPGSLTNDLNTDTHTH